MYIHIYLSIDMMSMSQTKVGEIFFLGAVRHGEAIKYEWKTGRSVRVEAVWANGQFSRQVPSPPLRCTMTVPCLCVSEALSIGQWRRKGKSLEKGGTNIFHYKSLNTNWRKNSTARILFHYAFLSLGITGVETPHSHFFLIHWNLFGVCRVVGVYNSVL